MAAQGMPWPLTTQNTYPSNDSYDRGGFKGSSGSSTGSVQRDKVYVQNIPLTMQEDSVETLFGKCGHVVEVKLLPAKDGRNTVAGFIKYATEEAAEEAINKMSGCTLGEGPPLRVMWPNSKSSSSGGQSDGRRGGGDRGNNQGFNQSNYDESRRQGQNRSTESPFGNYSDGPTQQTSTYGDGQAGRNNSYSQNSQPGNYGNQNSGQANFMSLLGRGENRNVNSSKPPGGLQNYGDNRQQSNSYPPLAPLKTSPNFPNTVSQQNGYQYPPQTNENREMPSRKSYDQASPAQQYQQEMPSNSYQLHQPAQGYHYQGESLSNGYQQPVPEQQQYYFQEQPPTNSYHTPPVPQTRHFQQQQPTNSYEQPPAPSQGYHFQEQQPPNQNFPAPNQGYPQNNQQHNSWGDSPQEGQTINNGPFGGPSRNQLSWQPREEPRSSGRDMTCHNCKEPGHFSRECPNPRTQDMTCHNCKEPGHFSRECPNPRTQGGPKCHRCGESGHFARECPTSTGPSGDQLCHKCGEAGHFARDCTSSPSRGGDQLCHKCGEAGHFARECTSSPSRGGGSNCHRCGEAGHFARECTNAPSRDNACHKCGEEGHFARECTALPSNNLDPSRPGPVTYIPQELPEDMDSLFEDMPHTGINFDKYDNIPVKASGHQGQDPPPPINTFDEVNFGSQTKANIRRAGFVKPTPVQKHAFPIAMSGLDLMACAQTGSGKTVAYLLPTLTSIINGGIPAASQSPLVICMAPTRELVVQIYKEAKKFADGTPVKVAVAYGGVSVAYQAQHLERGCHFLAATPGRLQDFVTRERVYLDGVKYLILDEADRMLDLGFGPAIRKLVEQCNMTPKEHRQTLMFSATFPNEIQLLAADFLKQDYIFLAVGCVGGTNLDIEQHILRVNGNDKRNKLFDILSESGTDRTLVFVELKRVADFLACLLSENNFPTTSISSDRSQQEREAALRDFRNGRANILVGTSVAARGLDIPDVKHVINYDLPQDVDEYVHRIGRTGRIGNKGKATSFFEDGRDEKLARSLVKVLSEAFQDVPGWLEQIAEDAIGSSYGPTGGRFTSKDHRQGRGRGRRRDDDQYINNAMSNLNIQNDPISNFGSQPYRQDNNNTIQDGSTNNYPPQGSRQGAPPQGGGGRGTGDSDDDWD
ncbi:probable ATP-dependent RNA helicase vasa-like isoform X2 [Actinia tenebrosa]|uniref:RNA helicase n=1 Tax=Actinia tenebrosa TaxID=6105 RepID=A0A6P8HKA5_ACTTE|nr:probable ATP-dependent RNA helicase vasa-like isoform X2 [Actinia tenebrosa]